MKTYFIADWRKRDEEEKVQKYLKWFCSIMACAVIILSVGYLCLPKPQNTANAKFFPNYPIVDVQNRLPQAPDKPYKTITATLTAYTPEVAQTDSTPFLTANQSQVKEGGMACPRNIKFGTLIEVFGKRYICNDRMALKNDGNFDIFMFNKHEALNFGRKVAEVKIY